MNNDFENKISKLSKQDKKLRKKLKKQAKLEQISQNQNESDYTGEVKTKSEIKHKIKPSILESELSIDSNKNESTFNISSAEKKSFKSLDSTSEDMKDSMQNSQTSNEKILKAFIDSTFISICQEINLLYDRRDALMPYATSEVVTKMLKKHRSRVKAVITNKKRRVTAYLAFFKDMKKADSAITMKDAGAKWNTLSESERAIYQALAQKENDAAE